MHKMFTFGNAEADGRNFFCWFVGRIDKWCREKNLPFDESEFGLRNRGDMEIKWGVHPKGQSRPEGWASTPGMIAISVLARGRFRIEFRARNRGGSLYKVLLKDEGDYVIWKEELEHSWIAEEDSRILTVRWEQMHSLREGI